MLHKSSWFLVNDVSVQPIGQWSSSTIESGTDRLYLNVGNKIQNKLHNIQQEQRPQLHGRGSLKSRVLHICKY